MDKTETLIIEQLKAGNNKAYQYLYDHHYAVLCHIAYQYVNDHFLAETIVGDVIFHVWEIRAELSIDTSIRSYFSRSVRNRCIDYLRSQYHQKEVVMSGVSSTELPVIGYVQSGNYPLGRLLEKELEGEIQKAVDRLPDECRRVFKLSRYEGKKLAEIAQEQGISINTVKYHIKRALTLIDADLHKYLAAVIIFFLHH